jgi:hypothetical protein
MIDGDATVLVVVLGLRLLVPLLVFRYPLPAILACLVIDAVDQTVFQRLTELPLDGYQGYDKALDIYYLCLAYIATLRNWTSRAAFEISRFLLYYRLVGVLAFELGDGLRALLLVFPNTFEFFFIFYEVVRTRWDPAARSRRFWLLAAAGIWIFVKLPQEYWIHVAQLDTTDLVREQPWVGVVLAAGVAVLLLGFWFGVRPRLDPPDHAFRLMSDPAPAEMDSGRERWAAKASLPVLAGPLVEKIALVSMVSIIFASILPGVQAALSSIVLALAVVITVNAALSHAAARRAWSVESALVEFALLAAVNAALVLLAEQLLDRALRVGPTLFFVLLVALVVTTYDRYRPVHDVRHAAGGGSTDRTSGAPSRAHPDGSIPRQPGAAAPPAGHGGARARRDDATP